MNAEMLSRVQFAMTIGFHFLFPPISIGLAWLLVILEYKGWRTRDTEARAAYLQAGKMFAKLLALTFVLGVATGITMEFQFGTNWSRYSKFVGDVFGAPLAAEGVFAFFLESGFLGLYLFGRKRVSKGVHWFSILMVAFGATLSAFWIIVANSWMQTPAGFEMRNGRAELTDFWAAVFNPSTMPRYHHTVTAAVVCGAFFMAGVSAWRIRKFGPESWTKKSLAVSVIVGLIASVLVAFPFGHIHAQQVARTQPEKFAAIEGLYNSQSGAPLVMFALPFDDPPTLKANIEVPGLLSWMAFGDTKAHIKGINEFEGKHPPLWLTFVSFHNMVVLGGWFILIMAIAAFKLWKGTLWNSRFLLLLLMISIPLPLAACQLGWMAAEVGRQPWIVYHVMETKDAFSPNVPAGQVLASIIMFGAIYALLLVIYLTVLWKKMNVKPQKLEEAALAAA